MDNVIYCSDNIKNDTLIMAAKLYGINNRTSIKRKAAEFGLEETKECQIPSTEFPKMNTILE